MHRRRTPVPTDAPLALYEKSAGALRVEALDAAARAAGLHPGQPLAEARALAPGLVAAALDRAADETDFARLAQGLMRYSPLVAAGAPHEAGGARAALIDIAGCAHLFGGERPLALHARARLAALGLGARAAISSSPAAAEALAAFHPQADDIAAIAPGAAAAAVACLPVEALRLDAPTTQRLRSLGLKTIGALAARGRRELAGRFGEALLARLDALAERREEPISPLAPAPALLAERTLAEPVATVEAALALAADLARELCAALEREGLGATRFALDLYRMDMTRAGAAIAFVRPQRDPAAIVRLLRLKLEAEGGAVDPGFGFESARLCAFGAAPLGACARDAFVARSGADAEALADELVNRFGRAAAFRLAPAPRHQPERAEQRVPLDSAIAPWTDETAAPRPLLLLDPPERIATLSTLPDGPPFSFRWRRVLRRVARAAGPERILGEWTRGEEGLRDYYRVEDEAGRRYWIFRKGLYGAGAAPAWFLHGLFP